VAQLAEAACNNVEKLLQYELPSTKTDFVPNVFYDVTTEFISKVEALECHESQMSKPYFNKRVIENIARFRAFQCKRYGMLCEAFYGNKIIEET
jgi:LmbE family N-acetylglucosaminyl deacetylase